MTEGKRESLGNFPCGCTGYFFHHPDGKKDLIILVDPDCKWDVPRIGKTYQSKKGGIIQYRAKGIERKMR